MSIQTAVKGAAYWITIDNARRKNAISNKVRIISLLFFSREVDAETMGICILNFSILLCKLQSLFLITNKKTQ